MAVSANCANLESFSVHAIYFGCLYPSAPNDTAHCVFHLLSSVQRLHSLSLSNVSIDAETATGVSQSIATNQKLMETLRILNLSGNPIIGESPQCIEHLARIIISADLHELHLKSCSISNLALNRISMRVRESGASIAELQELDVTDGQCALSNMGVVDLISTLFQCPNLRTLNLSHRKIQDGIGCRTLWVSLSQMPASRSSVCAVSRRRPWKAL